MKERRKIMEGYKSRKLLTTAVGATTAKITATVAKAKAAPLTMITETTP